MLINSPRSAFSILVLLVFLAGVGLPFNFRPAPAPVQQLEVLQTAEGPRISGLFGRFGSPLVPLSTCGTYLHCFGGSHVGPNPCCNDDSKSYTVFCRDSCNYTYCGSSLKPTCCGGGCIQDHLQGVLVARGSDTVTTLPSRSGTEESAAMNLKASLMIMLVVVSACCEYTYAHDPGHPQVYKWENGWMLVFDAVSSDASTNQIAISDGQGHQVTQLNILKLIEDAKRVTIYDVSANANLVAVAAVYQSKKGDRQVRPTATLLLFDLHGEFLSAFALAPTHAISRLAVDDRSHIWTLTDGAGTEADPSTVPMVVEFTADGKIVREVLTRDKFPFHALDTKSGLEMGSPVMGYSGVVWFWLPGSTDLVTISPNDGKAVVSKTQLPKRHGRREAVLSITREQSGNVIGQFREDDENLSPTVASEAGHYVWSPATGAWSQFKPSACEHGRLVGASERGPVYAQYEGDGLRTDNLCTIPAQ